MQNAYCNHKRSDIINLSHRYDYITTIPCSEVTSKEIAEAYVDEQDHLSNGIAHYIFCEEGWDRLLDLEEIGGKIRDTEDENRGTTKSKDCMHRCT